MTVLHILDLATSDLTLLILINNVSVLSVSPLMPVNNGCSCLFVIITLK